MTKKSLLEQALEIPKKHNLQDDITPEDIELVLAWLTGAINGVQLTKVKNKKAGNQYAFIATALREAYKQGYLKVKT